MTTLRAGAATDVGRVRATNQDNLLVSSPLFAVADGMGGHAAGEVASEVALLALEQAYEERGDTPEDLGEATRIANRAVWDRARDDPSLDGMGTTLVALAFEGDEKVLTIANVGDSRAYRWREGSLEQLTRDHNLVSDLVREGLVSEEEAAFHPQRNVVTRALGVDPWVDVDVFRVQVEAGDRFLLCSDGLGLEVPEHQVSAVLSQVDDPDEAAQELVHEATDNGGRDNVTVVIVDVVAERAATTAEHEQSGGESHDPNRHRETRVWPVPADSYALSEEQKLHDGGSANHGAGESAAGAHSSGEYSSGDYGPGEHSAGEHSAGGEYPAGEHSVGGEHTARDKKAGSRTGGAGDKKPAHTTESGAGANQGDMAADAEARAGSTGEPGSTREPGSQDTTSSAPASSTEGDHAESGHHVGAETAAVGAGAAAAAGYAVHKHKSDDDTPPNGQPARDHDQTPPNGQPSRDEDQTPPNGQAGRDESGSYATAADTEAAHGTISESGSASGPESAQAESGSSGGSRSTSAGEAAPTREARAVEDGTAEGAAAGPTSESGAKETPTPAGAQDTGAPKTSGDGHKTGELAAGAAVAGAGAAAGAAAVSKHRDGESSASDTDKAKSTAKRTNGSDEPTVQLLSEDQKSGDETGDGTKKGRRQRRKDRKAQRKDKDAAKAGEAKPAEEEASGQAAQAAPAIGQETTAKEAPEREETVGKTKKPPRARAITWRVVFFVVILLVVLVAAAVGVLVYARGSYYVGVQGNQVAIFKGRHDHVLFFKPTLEEHTKLTTGDLTPAEKSQVSKGENESSVGAARAYVKKLEQDVDARKAAATPPPPPPTTVPTPAPPPAPPVPAPAPAPAPAPVPAPAPAPAPPPAAR